MRKKITSRLVSASFSLMMLVAFCPMTTAFADKPNIVFIPVDETFTDSSDCGFDIVFHVEGRVKLTFNPDNPDLLIAEGDHLRDTLTNPANRKSISFRIDENLKVRLVEDGTSVLAIFTGDLQLTAPGQGTVFSQVGRIIIEFPCPDLRCRPTDVVFLAGLHDEDFSPVCELLAD